MFSVPPFSKYAVMPVARKLWQQVPSGRGNLRAQRPLPSPASSLRVSRRSVSWPCRSTERKRGTATVANAACCGHIRIEVFIEPVVSGHFMEFSALLVQANPPAFAIGVIVVDIHAKHCRDASEAEDHRRNERPIAKADDGRGCSMESRSNFAWSGARTRVLPRLMTCLGSHRGSGIHRQDWPITR